MENSIDKKIEQSLSSERSVEYHYIDFADSDDADTITADIVAQVVRNPNFYLGDFENEEHFAEAMRRKIFGESTGTNLAHIAPHVDIIDDIMQTVMKQSFDVLPTLQDLVVFVVPMCNAQASIDLKGVNGFPIDGGSVLFILIDTENPEWRRSLVETMPHEYAHLVYTSQFDWNSILDGCVNEGLAEHFRELVVGGGKAPWSTALSKKEALEVLATFPEERLNLFIDESNVDLYISYFFGTGVFPKWYGYSLGYWLIDTVLTGKTTTLQNLFTQSPKEIFEQFKTRHVVQS